MLIRKNKKTTKRGSESRRIREQGESTFDNIDEKDEYNLNNDNFKKRQISSEEININSSSVDVEKLKIKKKVKSEKEKINNKKKLIKL